MKEYIGYCTASQIERMFQKFYQDTEGQLSKKLAQEVMKFNRPVSAAQIQGYFMMHKHDTPEVVITNVKDIWEV